MQGMENEGNGKCKEGKCREQKIWGTETAGNEIFMEQEMQGLGNAGKGEW